MHTPSFDVKNLVEKVRMWVFTVCVLCVPLNSNRCQIQGKPHSASALFCQSLGQHQKTQHCFIAILQNTTKQKKDQGACQRQSHAALQLCEVAFWGWATQTGRSAPTLAVRMARKWSLIYSRQFEHQT